MSCIDAPDTLEQALHVSAGERAVTIGLPATATADDQRFLLTPECASVLIERGFRVRMERGAGARIHYSDEGYAARGVEIVDRAEAFASDIVVYLPPLTVGDVAAMRRGALVLTFAHFSKEDVHPYQRILRKHITVIDLMAVADSARRHPFADILHEIDGRAAMAVAASMLADPVHGKGILLGGVAGVVPCEVMVIGSDIAACAAARSAIGMGATVRMFDDNIYSLRTAVQTLGPGVISSSMHTKVFNNALATADIVIITDAEGRIVVNSDMMASMKRGVIAFDLSGTPGKTFPAMQLVDLDLAAEVATIGAGPRVCYVNAGNTVPRTVAMALGNIFVALLNNNLACDGIVNSLKLNAGMRAAAVTFVGKVVSQRLGQLLGMRALDISIFLQFT